MKQTSPLSGFDFSLLDSSDFKEDSVREEVVHPILKALGYSAGGKNRIIRSKALSHPFVNIGSTRHKITIIPDYLLTIEGQVVCVLDAKAPDESIASGENVEQAYSYAIHPEVRAKLYALCNGKEFVIFQTDKQGPVFYCQLSEIARFWKNLQTVLAPDVFLGKSQSLASPSKSEAIAFDYNAVKLLVEIKNPDKQSARRHFGVHAYFTRQAWNVVQAYIKNFTQPADVVLDPFGGSGVTLVEALLLGRQAIHIDINPHSVFIVKNLISLVSPSKLTAEFDKILVAFEKHAPKTDTQIKKALTTYAYPQDVILPKNSDVQTVEELFSRRQLAQLAYLKYLIKQVKDSHIRGVLLLMFSGLLNKINLTYHASSGRSEGRGDSGVYRYYRYRLAPQPADLDLMAYFKLRLKKVLAAKKELAPFINAEALHNAHVLKGTATDLHEIPNESVDYIYTDPPYGKKIPYLDLSVMWNAWLDLPVSKKDYSLEIIEGGDFGKTKQDYSGLLARSIYEMYRVLKFDRWMSFVFSHKDPAYWHLIVETAEKAGFEYKGAVKQSNDKISFKKHQNPFTVLSGQLIITFKKTQNPKSIMRVNLGSNVTEIIMATIEGVIAKNAGATIEEINDDLIIKGLELGFLDILSKEYQDITPLLNDYFTYDDKSKQYHLPQNNKFKSRIDVALRIKYYAVSFLRRMEQQHTYPTFDEIILNVMPLLKNGLTPETQTILSVLEEIADRIGAEGWKLKAGQQINLL